MRQVDPTTYVGKRFHRWVALAPSEKSMILCRCDCGHEKYVDQHNLLHGKTKGCQRCSKIGSANPSWSGHKDIRGNFWGVLCASAAARNIPVTLTMQDLQDLWERQGGRCALSGSVLTMTAKGRGLTASVDRIDSARPYEKGNVQFVHKDVNLMKNKFDQDYFVAMCRRVANHA